MKHAIDARQLLCPMPVIRLQNKATSLAQDEQIEIVCTDPGTLQDIPCWCRINGHEVLSTHEADAEITFVIKIHER